MLCCPSKALLTHSHSVAQKHFSRGASTSSPDAPRWGNPGRDSWGSDQPPDWSATSQQAHRWFKTLRISREVPEGAANVEIVWQWNCDLCQCLSGTGTTGNRERVRGCVADWVSLTLWRRWVGFFSLFSPPAVIWGAITGPDGGKCGTVKTVKCHQITHDGVSPSRLFY